MFIHRKVHNVSQPVSEVVAMAQNRIVYGGVDGVIRVRPLDDIGADESDGNCKELDLVGHKGCILALAIAPNNEMLASSGSDATLRVWSLLDGKQMFYTAKNTLALTFVPDSSYLLSVGADSVIHVRSVDDFEEVYTLGSHTRGMLWSLAVSPDGQYVVIGGVDSLVHVWSLSTQSEIHCLGGHQGWIRSVVFTADSRCVVSASGDGTARLWSVDTGEEVLCFGGHTGQVISVTVTPDNRYVVTGGCDRTIRVWLLSTGEEVQCLDGHIGWGQSAVAAISDDQLLSWCGTAVHLWANSRYFAIRELDDIRRLLSSIDSDDGDASETSLIEMATRAFLIEHALMGTME